MPLEFKARRSIACSATSTACSTRSRSTVSRLISGRRRYANLGPIPLADLRAGWDLHVEFGLSHPAIYLLMYASLDPAEIPRC